MRTHKKYHQPIIRRQSWHHRIEDWLADMPAAKANRMFRFSYYGLFGVWMMFAVCLFITPLVLP